MRILAFDPSSKTNLGFSCLSKSDNDTILLDYGVEDVSADDVGEKLNNIYQCVTRLINEYHPDKVVFETTTGGGFAPVRTQISFAAGSIILAANHARTPSEAIHGSSASLLFTGSGKSNKPSTKRRAKELFFPEYKTYTSIHKDFEHVADSIMIAFYAIS